MESLLRLSIVEGLKRFPTRGTWSHWPRKRGLGLEALPSAHHGGPFEGRGHVSTGYGEGAPSTIYIFTYSPLTAFISTRIKVNASQAPEDMHGLRGLPTYGVLEAHGEPWRPTAREALCNLVSKRASNTPRQEGQQHTYSYAPHS